MKNLFALLLALGFMFGTVACEPKPEAEEETEEVIEETEEEVEEIEEEIEEDTVGVEAEGEVQ